MNNEQVEMLLGVQRDMDALRAENELLRAEIEALKLELRMYEKRFAELAK